MANEPNEMPTGNPMPTVSLRGITKSFPGVVANSDINIDFYAGEVHALLGENGAGKSTLMNILTGSNQPDSGTIQLHGKLRELRSVAHAIEAGLGMVHQHFRLVNAFTVAENIHMGWKDAPRRLSKRELYSRTLALAEKHGIAVAPEAYVHQLSAGEQQRVEILRVLSRGAEILILDEPTAVLTPQEVSGLFRSLRHMKAAGKTIIFITHKLDEVLEIADRLTVLRRGQVTASCPNTGLDTRMLANLMVGRDVLFKRAEQRTAPAGEVLRLTGVSALNDRGLKALDNVSLAIRSGEILGIGGVAGNGQRELAEVITGLRALANGQITIDGKAMTGADPLSFARLGVGHIPEDRLRSGFAGNLPILHNAILREYRRPPIGKGAWFSPRAGRWLASEIARDAQVEVADLGGRLANLSGGNQQRLIAARERRIASRLLVAVYPTRGLDVGAIERLRHMLMQQRESGVAILLISEELDELMEIADRIAILYEGRIAGEIEAKEASREQLGLLMGGKTAAKETA